MECSECGKGLVCHQSPFDPSDQRLEGGTVDGADWLCGPCFVKAKEAAASCPFDDECESCGWHCWG
jgi:hypothetical protein